MTDNGIFAIVTYDDLTVGGGAPVFYCKSKRERDELVASLCGVSGTMAHDLKNGCVILLRH